ncbi:MAG: response regulator transcription factor [Sporolactobacillus sp.]
MTDIVIVDDHAMILMGLKELLEREPDFRITAALASAGNLEAIMRDHLPDLLIVDVRLKKDNGIRLTERMRHLFPPLKIIVFSGYDDSEYSAAAKTAGADAFVSKEVTNRELIKTIRAVLSGKKVFAEQAPQRDKDQLTDRELEVLKLVASGMTNAEIGEQLLISKRTVEYHIASIVTKLEADSRVSAVVNAIKKGLL